MKKEISSIETIDAKNFPKKLEKYINDAFKVNKKYFPRLTKNDFNKWINPKAVIHNRIQIYKNKLGMCVGFNAARFYKIQNNTDSYVVFSPYSFIDKDYIGNSLVGWFVLVECLKYKLNHLNDSLFLVTRTTVYSYYSLIKNAFVMYPTYKQKKTPAKMITILDTICHSSNFKQVNKKNPFVVDTSALSFTMEVSEKNSWRARSKDTLDIKYYIEHANLDKDKMILVIVPLSMGNLLLSGCKVICNLVNKRVFRPIVKCFKKKKTIPTDKGATSWDDEQDLPLLDFGFDENIPLLKGNENSTKLDTMQLNSAFKIVEFKKNKPSNQDSIKLSSSNDCLFKSKKKSASNNTVIEKDIGLSDKNTSISLD